MVRADVPSSLDLVRTDVSNSLRTCLDKLWAPGSHTIGNSRALVQAAGF